MDAVAGRPAAGTGKGMVSFYGFVLSDGGPIYLQIVRFVKQGIAAGLISNQEEVPSPRAKDSTIQKYSLTKTPNLPHFTRRNSHKRNFFLQN